MLPLTPHFFLSNLLESILLIISANYSRTVGLCDVSCLQSLFSSTDVDPRRVLMVIGHHSFVAVAFAHCVFCYRWELIIPAANVLHLNPVVCQCYHCLLGSLAMAVVRAAASHQCGSDLILAWCHTVCGLSLLLVVTLLWFSSLLKRPTVPNSNLIKMEDLHKN